MATYCQKDTCLVEDGPHLFGEVTLHIFPPLCARIVVWIILNRILVVV